MMHKKRGYKRDTPIELVRDYKLFAIACEGSKREPCYFNLFQYISCKIKVDVIEDKVSNIEMQRIYDTNSAPKWVLDRAVRYIEKEGLLDEDELWFVMDVDRWTENQLREIAHYCEQKTNWNIVLSNPCFEVWLYFHKKANIRNSKSSDCSQFKFEISKFEKGGYHPYKFIYYLKDAISNSKAADSHPEHFMPSFKETKVYQLAEALITTIGQRDFDDFLKVKLPMLIKTEIKSKKAKKK